ncbi:MAG: DUF3347 domain-containing protein [Bacteroidetes bacterium]|nr:DUF3347 domain-containing protein [Bacteroidota bacterium]
MKKIFFAIISILIGQATMAQNTDKLLTEYLAIKDALIVGNSQTVSNSLTTFQATLKSETDFKGKEDLLKASEKMSKKKNIEDQRGSLSELSIALWKIVKASANSQNPVYYDYCPMKKAYWISKDKEIKNPYYGTAMLGCGKISESKN